MSSTAFVLTADYACAESDAEAAEEAKKYGTFWKEFGKAIKLGIIEDVQNRQRLAKLIRFETSKSEGKSIGLDAYIANMKEGQKSIYYLAGVLRRFCLLWCPWFRSCKLKLNMKAGIEQQRLAVQIANSDARYMHLIRCCVLEADSTVLSALHAF